MAHCGQQYEYWTLVLILGSICPKVTWKKTGLEFSSFSNDTMNNCVMAIEGLVVKTKKPSRKDVGNVKAYRNRKCCCGFGYIGRVRRKL